MRILFCYITKQFSNRVIIFMQESTVPKNQEECCQMTLGVLSHPKTRPVIVIVDAINQVNTATFASIPGVPKSGTLDFRYFDIRKYNIF